jgi:hypothetical protein
MPCSAETQAEEALASGTGNFKFRHFLFVTMRMQWRLKQARRLS